MAKGFTQEYGFDFSETFLPVVKPSTISLLYIIDLNNKWDIKHLDVNNAFFQWFFAGRHLHATTSRVCTKSKSSLQAKKRYLWPQTIL